MTDEQIEDLRAELAAASPGAWSTALISLPAPGVAALLDKLDRLTDERDAAFRRGAEAMREAAAQALSTQGNGYYGLTGSGVAKTIRALSIPEDKS
jgi:hypothetical protein